MAMLQSAPARAVPVPSSRRFTELAVTAFVAVLALSVWAPPAFTAALGVVLLAFGLLVAAGLALSRASASRPLAWDMAAAATFLGFVATLVSDASVLPL
jgi:hypothetical protein